MEERDVIIIGGGPAGYAAAIRVSQLGGKATLIERQTLGGTCLNHGCIPIGSLARTAELFDMGKNATDYGITYSDISVDFGKIMARKETLVNTLVAGVDFLLNVNKVELLEGMGAFISPLEIRISQRDKKKKILRARKIIIATGSRCKKMPAHTRSKRVIDTTQALNLSELPKSILVVGGGFIGITFAEIFSKLGTETHIIEESSCLLPLIDREIVAIFETELNKNKITTYTNASIINIIDDDSEAHVTINANGKIISVNTQYVLMAEAREANVQGLCLEKLGIQLTNNGGIAVNNKMESNIPEVLVAGDVTMEHMWAPVAYAEGITAAENAMGLGTELNYTAVPHWISTVPEIASVGMTEDEATARGYAIETGRFPFAANGMATILGQRTGLVKLVIDGQYHQILGVHIVGPGATDLLAGAALAIRLDVTPEDIGTTLHPHPSLSEVLWEAARDVNGEAIHSPTPRK